MTIWLTSDSHFSHANMLNFRMEDGTPARPRPDGTSFFHVDECDELMCQEWCKRVKPQDHLWHLGDVAMHRTALERILPTLPGHKRLIRGNHDIFKTAIYLKVGFQEIYGSRVLNNLLFTHIPVHPGSMGRFTGNVHGHLHKNPSPEGPYLNVSVEQTAYAPVSLEEVSARMAKRRETVVDCQHPEGGFSCDHV